MSLKRTSSAAGLPDRDDDAPYCWLCLGEGSNDSGEPLIRDCSCRGTSGFAHLSCAVEYAERKGGEEYQIYGCFGVPLVFAKCPNCNQEYQGDVKHALATAQVEFVEREYNNKNDLELYLCATIYNLTSLMRTKDIKKNEEKYRREGECVCSKVLSIINQMNKNDSSLGHEDQTRLVALSNMVVGDFFEELSSNDYLEKAKKHFMQSKDLYEELGDDYKMDAKIIERRICGVVAKLSGTEAEVNAVEELVYRQEVYNHFKSSNDETEISLIEHGIKLALALHSAHHSIESERILTKLMQICHRIHGQDHRLTERILAKLERVRTRLVNMGADVCYQALRYENDGESIVVQGPVIDEEKRDEETRDEEKKVLTVESKDVIPLRGTPVIVHNLPEKSMSHLNGKIGDIRAYSEDNRTCEIHFEEEGLDPAFVKLENVRILFDLPEKEETEESK